MVFSSLIFLYGFLPLLLVCYFIIPQKYRGARNGTLLLFSLAFYTYGGPTFLLLMVISIAINYVGGRLASPEHSHHRCYMWGTVIANLALLGWFKYAMFVGEMLQSIIPNLVVPTVVLPIGISFFTFQGLSYVLDVYRGKASVEKNPLSVALYISLFPQLVAGPIVRYTTISDEIGVRKESISDASQGALRFVYGLAKKMILANALGELADVVYGLSASELTTVLAWLGAIGYMGQIYFDFSAYSDMAIGLGRIFGFHFLENFNYPYIAQSITDFWRRWHMSLSAWFRDYVYIPLGGNRTTVAGHLRNLLIVWLLTGIWHGAAWTFIAWGLYFGVLLAGEKYLWGKGLARLPRGVRHGYAVVLICVSWVIFRATDMNQAGQVLSAMAGFAQDGLSDVRTEYYLRTYGWALLLAIPAATPIKNVVGAWLEEKGWHIIHHWGPVVLALVLYGYSFLRLVSVSFNPFIYFRF